MTYLTELCGPRIGTFTLGVRGPQIHSLHLYKFVTLGLARKPNVLVHINFVFHFNYSITVHSITAPHYLNLVEIV